ncbi:hypothetical protein EOD12_36115, partial [Mesorhizobium sp. M7A.T.Ca.TU.009.02.1.1]
MPKVQSFPSIAPASAIDASIWQISLPAGVPSADSFDEPALGRLAFFPRDGSAAIGANAYMNTIGWPNFRSLNQEGIVFAIAVVLFV